MGKIAAISVLMLAAFAFLDVQASLLDVMDNCCNLGVQWFTQSRKQCTQYYGTLQEVAQADQMSCTSIVHICCLTEKQRERCEMGKEFAKRQDSCSALDRQTGSEDAKECCNCCKLGLVAQQQGLSCSLFHQYGSQCGNAFQACCHGHDTVVTEPPVTTRSPAIGGGLPDGDEIDECEQFPGELCAHRCVNTPGSYRCECHEGFELQADQRTCKQNTGDRCDTTNPCQHKCVDTGVAIHCECFEGFSLQLDSTSCRDTDECAEGTYNCAPGQTCRNTEGSYACVGTATGGGQGGYGGGQGGHGGGQGGGQGGHGGGQGGHGGGQGGVQSCQNGYAYNRLTQRCDDIDECTISRHTCLPTEECYNTEGSFYCRTITDDIDDGYGDGGYGGGGYGGGGYGGGGYGGGGYGGGGVDDGRGGGGGVDGGVEQCPPGYSYNRVSAVCEDINECLTDSHNCQGENQVCRNTYGSHTCSCEQGFNYDARSQQCEDVNECATGIAACLEGQTCENTPGSYHCRRNLSCGTGYTLDRESQQCVDDDECRMGTHNCGVARECHNIPGSFRCLNKECPAGYRLDYRTGQCDPVNCPRGLKPDQGGNCIDLDECVERPGICRPNQECRNSVGSYTCSDLINCGVGFTLNEAGSRCEDVDECATSQHECTGRYMTCVNRPGTYMCQCPEGYQMNQETRSCEDIDECDKFGTVCAQNAECQNSPGSFRCICKAGFESFEDGRTCRDIDECERPGMCQHECRNTWGSFQCTCYKGYKIGEDKRTCIDVDECEEYKDQGNLCVGICQNTPGSFTCSCPDGYNLLNDGRTCQDIDECALNTANCNGPDDICINTRGSYKCKSVTCPSGFVKAPAVNNRNNNVRCQRRSFVCPQGDQECLYAPLSYSMNFMSFPSGIQVPADLFTMRVPYSPYRRLDFELKLLSGRDPRTHEARVTADFFELQKRQNNEAVVQLLQQVEGPQDIELQLDMNIYSKEFAEGDEIFFGTAVAKITVYVTKDPWIETQDLITGRQRPDSLGDELTL